MSSIWRSARIFMYRRILHADDTPHRIALGVALATFVGFTPTMGMQTIIALALAAIFRANKAVCFPFVWITNPVTFGPIYWSCWKLGAAVVPVSRASEAEVMQKLLGYSGGGFGFITGLFSYDFWAGMFHLMMSLGAELWIGCAIVGLVAGTVMYFVTKWTVIAYRARRAGRIRQGSTRKRSTSRKPGKKIAIAGDSA